MSVMVVVLRTERPAVVVVVVVVSFADATVVVVLVMVVEVPLAAAAPVVVVVLFVVALVVVEVVVVVQLFDNILANCTLYPVVRQPKEAVNPQTHAVELCLCLLLSKHNSQLNIQRVVCLFCCLIVFQPIDW